MSEVTMRIADAGELWRNGDTFYIIQQKNDREVAYAESRVMEALPRRVDPAYLSEDWSEPLDGGTSRGCLKFDGHRGWVFVAEDAESYIKGAVRDRAEQVKRAIIEKAEEDLRAINATLRSMTEGIAT